MAHADPIKINDNGDGDLRKRLCSSYARRIRHMANANRRPRYGVQELVIDNGSSLFPLGSPTVVASGLLHLPPL